ncbi:hypothetical protein N7528_006674 [Penicillium herquei]|nr:hypothetical protein N7528_006674 [Penicillium herquei]
MRGTKAVAAALQLLLLSSVALADDNACSADNPCTEGCCSSTSNVCGYGPNYCGSSCIADASYNSTCSHLSECDPGVYPGYGDVWGSTYASAETCPLDVCCSEYGYCGTTSDFCGNTTWASPSCSGTSATERRIGYYEGWNLDHSCDTMTPEEIPVGGYTHLIFSFLYIDPDTYELAPMETNQTGLYSRFAALKDYGVEVWISIGGWDMNDPGVYSDVFTTLAGSTTAQTSFFSSLKSFLEEYGYDGVDIDWEYPGASDRYGTAADYVNYVTFLQNLRSSLGDDYGLSITLPSSYWYLQNFDIVNISKTIDWFNFMSYDIYGTWDSSVSSIGSYVYASTNLTMIDSGLQLLWHNDIEPSQVNLGLGYYGRSYTLNDTSCIDPGCPFISGGNPGPCTKTEGMLSYTEIMNIVNDSSRNPTVWLDSTAAVKIAVFDEDQWVAYDDDETLALKLDLANERCMGGVFAWAVDEDNEGDLSESLSNSTDLFPAEGDGEVYVLPAVWDLDSPEVSCYPPCTFILPPYSLSTSHTITWPSLTTPVLVSTGRSVVTSTTTISVPDFVIGEIPFWPVTIAGNTSGIFTPMQSIAPPSIILDLPGTIDLIPVVSTNYSTIGIGTIAVQTGTITSAPTTTTSAAAVVTPTPYPADMESGCTEFYLVQSGDSCWSIEQAYGISAADFEAWNPDVGTDCADGIWLDYYYCVANEDDTSLTATAGSTKSNTGVVWYTTSHSGTIQPGATHTTIVPSPTIPPINVVINPEKDDNTDDDTTDDDDNSTDDDDNSTDDDDSSSSKTKTTSDTKCDGCGSLDCDLWGCDGGCGIFGCDGGCGLWWCGGGCGLGGCGPGCGESGGCLVSGGGGGDVDDVPEPTEDEDCTSMVTATVCTVLVQTITASDLSSTTVSSTTYCGPVEGCSATPSTTTTTIVSTEVYPTETNAFMYVSEPVEASSLLASLSSSIVSLRDAMDATRWGSATATPTPTADTNESSSASTTSKATTKTESTSTSTTTTESKSTTTSSSDSSSSSIEANTPPTSDYYELNMYTDSSCGTYLIDDEGSDSEYNTGCLPWDYDDAAKAVYPLFDETVFSISAYTGDSCSEDLTELKSGTCYALDIATGKGGWKVTAL